jgi:hypothetical protein
MCIRQILTQSGIPVKFNDQHEPAFSGLRKTLGLKVKGQEPPLQEQTSAASVRKPIPFLPRAREGKSFIGSAQTIKMGSGSTNRKLIRGY